MRIFIRPQISPTPSLLKRGVKNASAINLSHTLRARRETIWVLFIISAIFLLSAALTILCISQADAQLPSGFKAVWDPEKAFREKTATRERICLNGLWRWQPANDAADVAPNDKWGYFKVPGSWPGITNYMQKDSQTIHAHPSWKDKSMSSINTAWYQREITIPGAWAGRRIAVNDSQIHNGEDDISEI